MERATGGKVSSSSRSRNPWGDGEVSSSHGGMERLQRSIGSRTARSNRSSGSSRSAHSSVSLRRMDAASEAAALRAQLLHMEMESRIKVEIEHKRAELEQVQIQRELEMANARLQVISEMEAESYQRSLDASLPASDEEQEYVRDYVSSLQLPSRKTKYSCSTPNPGVISDDPELPSVQGATIPSATPAVPSSFMDSSVPAMSPAGPRLGVANGLATGDSPPFATGDSPPIQPIQPCDLTDLATTLADQVSIGRLPPPEPGVFSGNPLEYPKWLAAFESLIETKAVKPAERLYYLKRYLSGEARDAVEGYFMLESEHAYQEAKILLKTRYGDQYTVAKAFRAKLHDWNKVPARDGFALRKFSDFLRQCEAAMKTNKDLRVLDDCNENSKLAAKLPDWLVYRWNRKVHEHKQANGEFPPFKVFVNFVFVEANIACEPSLMDVTSYTKIKSQKPSRAMATGVKEVKCLNCEGSHYINNCEQLLAKPVEERKNFVKGKGLCYGCLRAGHRSKECKRRLQCKVCQKKHPTLLHGDFRDKKEENKDNNQSRASISHLSKTSQASMASMVVPVYVSHQDAPNKEVLVYALLDTQSDTTFIQEDIQEELGIEGQDVTLSLSTMSTKGQMVPSKRIRGLRVRKFNGVVGAPVNLPPCYSRPSIPANKSHVPTPAMATKWPHLHRIAKDIPPLMDCKVGLLIGYDCPSALAPREVIPPEGPDQPFGQRTDLGWGIVGIIDQHEVDCKGDAIGISHRVMTVQTPSLPSTSKTAHTVQFAVRNSVKEVADMMELDFNEYKHDKMLSVEDREFLRILENGIHQLPDQHYEMPLPFKHDQPPELPNNKVQAIQRLVQLRKRMKRDTKYRDDYEDFMANIISSGFAEEVPDSELENCNAWYIPHHGVYHSKKPDKIRIVFDCSARFQGESLNDHLLQGPELTNTLTGVLCRFRKEPIAFVCDIQQMFFQFYVNKENRDHLRFLWWKEAEYDSEPVAFRMNVHLFGACSSPGCANFGLKKIADDYEEECGHAAASFVRENFYVDDGLLSVLTVEQAKDVIKSTKDMCSKGGITLHKFLSNSKEVMATIPQESRAKAVQDLNLLHDKLPVERALGIFWCVESDTFQFRITLKDLSATKRGVLSTINSIYDPLGFLAPLLLPGKLILQELCRQGDWDDPIPEAIKARWDKWRRDILCLDSKKLDIRRAFQTKGL